MRARTHTPHSQTGHLFDGLSPFTTCTLVCFSTVLCADGGDLCMDGGDLCEADDSKLTTARSQMPQLPPHFSEVSHATTMVFFLLASLLKVEKL